MMFSGTIANATEGVELAILNSRHDIWLICLKVDEIKLKETNHFL
jgi:hypothetical protein